MGTFIIKVLTPRDTCATAMPPVILRAVMACGVMRPSPWAPSEPALSFIPVITVPATAPEVR